MASINPVYAFEAKSGVSISKALGEALTLMKAENISSCYLIFNGKAIEVYKNSTVNSVKKRYFES